MGPSDQLRLTALVEFVDPERFGLDSGVAAAACWLIHPFSDSVEPRNRHFEKSMRAHSRKMAKAIKATMGYPEATRAVVAEGLAVSLDNARASGELFYVEKYGAHLNEVSGVDGVEAGLLVDEPTIPDAGEALERSHSPSPVEFEPEPQSGGLYAWSLGLGVVSVVFGSTLGLLAWLAVVVSVVALFRGAEPSSRRWWAWLGLGLGLAFALVNAELNGHLDRLQGAVSSFGVGAVAVPADSAEARDAPQAPFSGWECGLVSVGPHSLYLGDSTEIDFSGALDYSESQLEEIKECVRLPVRDTGWVDADSRFACDGVEEERFVSWESEGHRLILGASRGKWAGSTREYNGEYWTGLVASGWSDAGWWGHLGMEGPPQTLGDVQSVPWITWEPVEDTLSSALVLPVYWGADWIAMVDTSEATRLTQSIGLDCSSAAGKEGQEGILEFDLPDLHPLSAMSSPSALEGQWNSHPDQSQSLRVDAFSSHFADSTASIEGRQDCGGGLSPCGAQPIAAVVLSSGDLVDGAGDQMVANMTVLFDIIEPFPSSADLAWLDAAVMQVVGSGGASACQVDGTDRRTASGFQLRLSCDPILNQIEFSVVAPLGIFPETEEFPSIEELVIPSQPMPQLSESVVDDPGYLVFEVCSEERSGNAAHDGEFCNALAWVAAGLRAPRLDGPLGDLEVNELDAVFCHGWRAGNSAVFDQVPLWPSVADAFPVLPNPDVSCEGLGNPVGPSAVGVPIAACKDSFSACTYSQWPEPDPTATEAVWCLGASSAVEEAFNESGLALSDNIVDAILIDCARRAGFGE